MRRRLTTILVTMLLAAGAVLAGGSPASAASCSGNNCSGMNPNSTGCSTASAYTQATANAGYGDWNLELRRSSQCNSYWARVTGYHHVGYVGATISVDRRYDYNGYTAYQSVHVDHGQALAYTNMWGRVSGYSFRACLTFDQGLGTACTGWYS
ncbi:DUF2690 domain-containing protein [Micromonospora zamorensis]|uniref:DUF2690 domain-containing protein n=1 Tax=Micromonospora zamorensis TaxID=709883 RepID=A0ABZ1P8U9_9ACTN|nr:DUF2690 domain-containing protein [Micromonospora zamorensis]